MSDPTAARENVQVELACPSIRTAPSKNPEQKQDSRIGFEPRWIARDDVETVSYPLPADVDKTLYVSVSEGLQIERRPIRFTIRWAQIIVNFMVGSIEKIFQLRYALTFQSVCGRKVISFVQTAVRLFYDLLSSGAQGSPLLDLKPSHLKRASLL